MKKNDEPADCPPEDAYFALLYAPGHTGRLGEAVTGSTWLQKMMFVMADEIPGLELGFDGHDYGPYSRALEAIHDRSVASGAVLQRGGGGPITLTGDGAAAAGRIWEGMPQWLREAITEAKGFFNDMTSQELAAVMYSSYPGTAGKSEIMTRFEQSRLDSAISLFKKEKITLAMALQVAGTTRERLVEELMWRGIRPYGMDSDSYERSPRAVGNTS